SRPEYRVDTTSRAHRGLSVVHPFVDFVGPEKLHTVEATTFIARQDFLPVPTAMLVGLLEAMVRPGSINWSGHQTLLHLRSVRPGQQIDRVDHVDVEAALSHPGHQLEQTAGVADGHRLRPRGGDIVQL